MKEAARLKIKQLKIVVIAWTLTKCGEFKEELLASSDLLLALHYAKSFITKPLGGIKLKVKSKEIMLSSILAAKSFS